VSHSVNAIRRTCARVLVLHDGVAKFFGPTDEAISMYHELVEMTGDEAADQGTVDSTKEILGLNLLDAVGADTRHVKSGDDVVFRFDGRVARALNDPIFTIRITTETGQLAFATSTYGQPSGRFEAWEPIRCDVKMNCRLATGSYTAMVWIRAVDEAWRSRRRVVEFFVSGRHLVQGVADLDASIEITGGGSGAGKSEATSKNLETQT
jgi:hypothetical protein